MATPAAEELLEVVVPRGRRLLDMLMALDAEASPPLAEGIEGRAALAGLLLLLLVAIWLLEDALLVRPGTTSTASREGLLPRRAAADVRPSLPPLPAKQGKEGMQLGRQDHSLEADADLRNPWQHLVNTRHRQLTAAHCCSCKMMRCLLTWLQQGASRQSQLLVNIQGIQILSAPTDSQLPKHLLHIIVAAQCAAWPSRQAMAAADAKTTRLMTTQAVLPSPLVPHLTCCC
jgi:hypothetical protein